MNWQKEYESKIVSAEEAVKAIKSGDRVVLGPGAEPKLLKGALFARGHEVKDVEIIHTAAQTDPGWYAPGHPSFLPLETILIGDIFRPCLDDQGGDFIPAAFSTQFKVVDERHGEGKNIDVLLTVVSPPNEHGFCSFGADLWNKKSLARRAKLIIAEADERQIITYGDNFIHVSEIAYYVKYTPPIIPDSDIAKVVAHIEPEEKRRKVSEIISAVEPSRRAAFLLRLEKMEYRYMDVVIRTFALGEPDKAVKEIARHVAPLIRDGDTIQIGARHPSALLPRLGVFDNRIDLGIHSEISARGIITLIKEGVITGKHKTLHPGKAVFSSLANADAEELAFADKNPLIELHATEYVVDIPAIAAHDNMVSINNALAVDFTGQINVETAPGPRLWSGCGGQPEFHIGAVLSKGGRAITLLRSTAMGGVISRIVPLLDHGSVVTIPRYFADYVVTEYGVARLMGKSCRERAEALIAIAHPNFQEELRKEAKRLFYH